MSEQASRRPSAPSVLVTLGGAALLIAVGFAVGLLAGVAYEQPDLLVEPLVGRATSVSLAELLPEEAEAEAASGLPALPLRQPERPRTEATLPVEARARPEVAAAPPPERAPAAQPAAARPRQGFAIQVGAFGDAEGAERLLEQLRSKGFAAYLADAGAAVPARFRVRVGPVASRAEAGRLASRLKDGHRLPTWVLTENGS